MTFKDFITECENYPHSKEHFDLMKESSELCLTEQFLMDQEFMVTNSAIFEGVELPEGYLHESVDESTIDVMMEKFETKKAIYNSKIFQGLQRILEVFKKFFIKIGNKFDSITSKGQEVRKKLADAKLEASDIASIKSIVDGVKGKETSNFPVRADQPYINKIKFGNFTSSTPENSALKNDIAAALSDTSVVADVMFKDDGVTKKKETIGAIPAEDIKDALARLKFSDSEHTAIGVISSLESSWASSHSKGLKIRVNTNEIMKLASELDKISSKVNQKGRSKAMEFGMYGAVAGIAVDAFEGRNNKDGEKSPEEDSELNKKIQNFSAKGMEKINQAYSIITSAIGQSMKIYSSLNSYRSGVIDGLASFLKSK